MGHDSKERCFAGESYGGSREEESGGCGGWRKAASTEDTGSLDGSGHGKEKRRGVLTMGLAVEGGADAVGGE